MNIWIAASDNKADIVKDLISSGKHTANDKDVNGYTPIHAAASYGYHDLLTYLIKEQNGDVNITDNEGDTPLHTVEDLSTAKLLISLGADISIKNDDGQTPLEKQVEEDEYPEVITYLTHLKNGTDPEEVSERESMSTDAPGIVSYRYENEADMEEIDPERRKQIEEIMESENPEEGLRELLKSAIHSSREGGETYDYSSKSRRTE